jgi:hypothetical protein
MVEQTEDIYPECQSKGRIIDDWCIGTGILGGWKVQPPVFSRFYRECIENAIDNQRRRKMGYPYGYDFEMEEIQWSPVGDKIVYASKKLYVRICMSTIPTSTCMNLILELPQILPKITMVTTVTQNFRQWRYISWWSMATRYTNRTKKSFSY